MKRGVGNDSEGKSKGQDFIANKRKMKKNMKRLGSGRGGLSLESFANARTKNDNFNPALIKKQREFYKNAKHVKKYKKSLKQQQQPQSTSSAADRNLEGENALEKEDRHINKYDKKRNNSFRSLGRLYERTKEEEEKARMEREAMIQSKNEKIRIAEARRKNLKENMNKKTKLGQPVMKFRIEHLLETIQGSTSK